MNYWIKTSVLALIIGSALSFWQVNDSPSHIPTANISFPDLQGQKHTLDEWRGKVVVLNFWASWCQPCREEIPLFIAAQSRYKADNLQIIGIAIDNPTAVQTFAENFAINYPLLIAEQEGIDLSFRLGNNKQGLPYTVVISPGGRVTKRHLGAINERQLHALLTPFIPDDLMKNTMQTP